MKATIFISSSNVSCLVATVSTFDVSKPIYSSSLRRLKRRLDSNSYNYEEMASFFGGLDAPTVRLERTPDKQRPGFGLGPIGDDEDEEAALNRVSASSSAGIATNQDPAQNSVSMRNQQQEQQEQPLLQRQSSSRYDGSSHSSNATTHDDSVLMQLSPEHLMLIRTILLLKFFVARRKFKLAFKPYDFKV